MDILECIDMRRSVRAYAEKPVSDEELNRLIELGTKAATGSNGQPWGFLVVQGKEEIEGLSSRTKEYLLENLETYPYLKQYGKWLENPKFSVFNHASTLLAIYGDTASHWYLYDCTLAAGNIMLAAHGMGIGTCWIGFAEYTLNTPEFKVARNVPRNYELVCPMSLGYMDKPLAPPERRAPLIFGR